MKCMLELSIKDLRWSAHDWVDSNDFSTILYMILNKFYVFRLINQVTLSLLLTNNKFIQKLNLQFRKINKPTDVLSFVNENIHWKDKSFFSNDNHIYLGDIAFAYESIYMESKSISKSFLEHFQHLFVHSVLHLLGYHHETDDDANLMEFLENEILTALPSR